MVTYANEAAVEQNWAFITHTGSCGVCSTTKDLAVQAGVANLEQESVKCTLLALNFTANPPTPIGPPPAAIACYANFGFTPSCAQLWIFNSFYSDLRALLRKDS
eukprot:g75430.t1